MINLCRNSRIKFGLVTAFGEEGCLVRMGQVAEAVNKVSFLDLGGG